MTLERWERASEWPLAAAALLFLALYAWVIVGRPEGVTEQAVEIALLALWCVFTVDYLGRLILAPQRGRWFLRHLHLLALVALPFFRPLYLLRLVALLSVLQRATGTALRGRVTLYVICSALLIVLIGALAMLDAEQDAPGALITTFEEALWWAMVTITTVGYGDFYPVTTLGRIIAAGVMIAGIALVGSVTATLASWFVERIRDEKQAEGSGTSG